MFREMRRFKQQLTEEEADKILENGKTGILAVNGDDGFPYTVPINYVYKNGKLYFHGARAGHKYDAMLRSNKVSFCVIDKDDVVAEKLTTYFRSVIAFGTVRLLEGEELLQAAYDLGIKYYNNDEAVQKEIDWELNALACFEITIEHLTGKEAIELTRMRNGESEKAEGCCRTRCKSIRIFNAGRLF